MINPYTILNIRQDADRNEIKKAQMIAMKAKKFGLNEISMASRQLLEPAKRLAADFMFPAKLKAKRPKKIFISIEMNEISLENVDVDVFDSLKYYENE